MDVVVFFNGLGNQMSQYAFFLKKRAINSSTAYINICKEHNGLELNRIFNLNIKSTIKERVLFLIFKFLIVKKLGIFRSIIKTLGIKADIIDENFNYNFKEEFLQSSEHLSFYYGGWPSEKYFLSVKEQVLDVFVFPKFEDPENLKCEREIKLNNSVAIHIRRGDYLSAENMELFGRVCTKEYFETAILLMEEQIKEPHFYIFSNDIPWVEANLKFKKYTVIDFNSGNNSWKDMALMSKCKHNIISNSTFSWWGAYLNANPEKIVISPSRYLNNDITTDFYPEDWIRLTDY